MEGSLLVSNGLLLLLGGFFVAKGENGYGSCFVKNAPGPKIVSIACDLRIDNIDIRNYNCISIVSVDMIKIGHYRLLKFVLNAVKAHSLNEVI